jgi:hypothetical protein
VLAGSAQAETVRQFDLQCTGTEQRRLTTNPKEPYTVRYRIDLDAMKWCSTRCGTIKEVNPEKIILERDEPATSASSVSVIHWLFRASGELVDFYHGGGLYWDREARCEVAPFSGFPTNKF